MDLKAKCILRDYLNKGEEKLDYKIHIVWKCKVLQNAKYLLCTDFPDNMYYELTFNGDKNEWYLDVYDKVENICVKANN